jgi:hypothetical protein
MKFNKNVVDWLLESNNPAIEYRTKNELLNEKADNSKVIDWINGFLPIDWKDTEGKWLTHYYTTIAECGINGHELGITKNDIAKYYENNPFGYGCLDYMQLRAFIILGFEKILKDIGIMKKLSDRQLSDGGFLCLIDKYKDRHKSCIKCNNMVLLFLSECKKKNINTNIEKNLINYFWNHNLFYKSTNKSVLILNEREGWRTIDTFFPFEVMRIGLQNIIEAFSVLGYGTDKKLKEAWDTMETKKDINGKYILNGTLTKSYLPKERVGKPSKWVTFYTLLAKKYKEKTI